MNVKRKLGHKATAVTFPEGFSWLFYEFSKFSKKL